VAGVIVTAWVCFERVTLGFHTIGQVTTGSVLAIALHLYSTSVPQFMVFVDTGIQLVAGLVLLFLDPALVFGSDDGSTCHYSASISLSLSRAD
jgi:membrane-associated phospholipid phosphatase